MKYLKQGMNVGLALLASSQLLAAAGDGVVKTKVPVPRVPLASETPSSITLDDAVRIALKQNPQVLEAIQLIEQTKGQIITVRAEALPNVTLATAYNQYDPTLVIPPSGASLEGLQEKTWDVSVQATQLIYSGGQVGAAIKIAKLTLDSNYYNLRDVVDQTISTVRQQFYDALLNRELIKVQEQSVELLKSQLKDQQNRFDAGTVPRFNVLQAQVALANQLPPLIRAKETYTVSLLTLARTLGIPYNPSSPGQKPLNVIGDLTVLRRSVNTPEAIRLAKEQRWFLKVQRQTILVQLQQIKVALAGYQPTLSASAGYEVKNSPFSASDKLTDIVNGWFFGVNGSWAIFDEGSTYGKVKTARALLESSKANYDDAVLQVELQVQQAIANLNEADETIASQTKSVEEAVEALRLAQERLNAGAGVQLDVLNAQVALLTAQSNELQAEHDYNVALAQFEYAIGSVTHYQDSFDDPLSHHKAYTEKTAAAVSAKDSGKISPKD
jgi:outer membrane protein TolC